MSDAKLTEGIVSELLREKYTRTGNGGNGEYAYMAGVRNNAGFDATRTFDGVAMSLWPSRGLRIEIFEIKVSRSDWQRELSKPAKAEDACRIADRFWIVAPRGCVQPGELPPTWGLIEVTGDGDTKPWKLRTKTSAPNLHDTVDKTLHRGFVVGMLRAVPGAVPGGLEPEVTREALNRANQAGYKAGIEHQKREQSWSQRSNEKVANEWRELQQALQDNGVRWADAGTIREHLMTITRQASTLNHLDRLKNTLEVALTDLTQALEADR